MLSTSNQVYIRNEVFKEDVTVRAITHRYLIAGDAKGESRSIDVYLITTNNEFNDFVFALCVF